jgi:adenosylmethionine-8-amino-7-oxononanoate aminotransferase
MDYLVSLVQLAKTFNIHVIFDEIAVGFGRTGHMFVCEQLQAVDSELCPDFVCLSKGLTAGYLPMSCVMTTDEVYNTFVDENVAKGFLHSHSFTGNPLAATAGLASLELFEQHQIIQANQTLIAAMAQGLKDLVESDLPIILPRQTGMIVAFTLDFAETRGKELAQFCLQQGVMIRPIGNHVYLIPPYCTTVEQLAQVFDSLTQGIKLLAQTTATSSPSIALA